MTLENFKRIVDECKGKTFQLALGGRGDVDPVSYTHLDVYKRQGVRKAPIIRGVQQNIG